MLEVGELTQISHRQRHRKCRNWAVEVSHVGFRRFEDIQAWQTARKIASSVYALTRQGEFSRDFSLRDQTRRAASSIMANIAEGFVRRHNREFVQFLSYAKSSGAELQSHLYVSLDAGYLKTEEFSRLYGDTDVCCKQLSRLISHLSGKTPPTTG
jgi:four helix bundle protein